MAACPAPSPRGRARTARLAELRGHAGISPPPRAAPARILLPAQLARQPAAGRAQPAGEQAARHVTLAGEGSRRWTHRLSLAAPSQALQHSLFPKKRSRSSARLHPCMQRRARSPVQPTAASSILPAPTPRPWDRSYHRGPEEGAWAPGGGARAHPPCNTLARCAP